MWGLNSDQTQAVKLPSSTQTVGSSTRSSLLSTLLEGRWLPVGQRRWELGPPLPRSASLEHVADLEPENWGCAFLLCHLLGITHVENLAI